MNSSKYAAFFLVALSTYRSESALKNKESVIILVAQTGKRKQRRVTPQSQHWNTTSRTSPTLMPCQIKQASGGKVAPQPHLPRTLVAVHLL